MDAVCLCQTPALPFIFCLHKICHIVSQKKIIQFKYLKLNLITHEHPVMGNSQYWPLEYLYNQRLTILYINHTSVKVYKMHDRTL